MTRMGYFDILIIGEKRSEHLVSSYYYVMRVKPTTKRSMLLPPPLSVMHIAYRERPVLLVCGCFMVGSSEPEIYERNQNA